MPLPPALAAKLAKRGLVEQQKLDPSTSKQQTKQDEEVEEVFAEDYDDPSRSEVSMEETNPLNHQIQAVTEKPDDEPAIIFQTTCCPFRPNPYHECLAWCRRKYGLKAWKPEPISIPRRERMLRKYPLPPGWFEVADTDTGRYYYWNPRTEQVSWLSPSHPNAQISQSAEALGLIGKVGNLDSEGEEEMETQQEEADEESASDSSVSEEDDDFIDKRGRVKNRKPIPEFRKGRKRDEIDPMDPASYSDIPLGGWSDGLDQRGKAKTGVDVTASGPLFQQRPYPSPGAILRANKDLKKK